MAILQPPNLPWKSLKLWIPTSIFYIFFIGLRHEVGSDWFNYEAMFNRDIPWMGYMDALHHDDPLFWLLMVFADDHGMDMHFVYLISSILFVTGMVVFLRRMPNPWLGLTMMMAYTILTLGMGYVRQGVALGVSLLAITALMDRRFMSFFLLVALATAFHKSAVVMLGFGIFQEGRHKYVKVLAALVLGAGIYMEFMSGQEERLVSLYIDNPMQSSGAYIRVFMNVIAAGIFLYYRKIWRKLWPGSYMLWMLMALGSLAAFVGVWIYSTAVDRISLYFIPLQIVVFSSLPMLLEGILAPRITTFLVICYYAAVYTVWLGFATWAYMWKPYQNILWNALFR